MAERPGQIGGLRTGHPDVDELLGYARGELSQRGATDVRVHAAACADCGDQLAALILLREHQLTAGDEVAPQATITRFPVPAKPPVRRWRIASAAAAVLVVGLAWFAWPAQVGDQRPFVAEGLSRTDEFEVVDSDVEQVMEMATLLSMQFDRGAQAVADGPAADEDLVAEALLMLTSGDLPAARTLLEPFGESWHRAGTALLGYVLFVLEDPAARPTLEMYAAQHPIQAWAANAEAPEDLAFFFVARTRHAMGDDIGAREAVGWIEPRGEPGAAAATWMQATLGDPAHGAAPDIRR